MEKEQSDIFVTNPATNEEHNCSDIVKKLYDIYTSCPKDVFTKYTNILNSCIEWDDTIEKQIGMLLPILNKDRLSQEFKKQLDKVILYANKRNQPYIPLSERFKELYSNRQHQKGISFLSDALDKRTGGIESGCICTIAGGPGSMKTTTAMNIAYQAMKDGKNVFYLTLEEPPEQLFAKLLSRISVDVGKNLLVQDITQQKLSEKDTRILFDEILPYFCNLPGSFHLIGEKDLVSYEFIEIERQLKMIDNDIKSKTGNEQGIDLIVVDHIQLLKYASNTKDEYRVMNEYVSFFRRQSLSFLSTDRTVTVILLSQVNREGIAYAPKHDGAYLMQHVAEASEVERASSYVISVYTSPTSQVSKLLKVGALKLRGAALPLDTVNLFADGQYYQVGMISTPEQSDYSMEDIGLDDSPKETEDDAPPSLEALLEGLF